MTQEEKLLLLKDLCARLFYEVKVLYKGQVKEIQYIEPFYNELKLLDFSNYTIGIEEIKPYLRPMSSMTEDERKEVENLIKENRPSPYGIINNKGIDNLLFSVSITSGVLTNWLNAHHFDYRGLIEKGLAIAVTKENNPYKE